MKEIQFTETFVLHYEVTRHKDVITEIEMRLKHSGFVFTKSKDSNGKSKFKIMDAAAFHLPLLMQIFHAA